VTLAPILERFAFVWRAKKVWRWPRRAGTLIYDRDGSAALLLYLQQSDVEILDVRGERVNLPVLFECIRSLDLTLGGYIARYIARVKPRVALTYMDNSTSFYQLKTVNPGLVTVFVQNGVRSELGDVFGVLKGTSMPQQQFKVDHMATFGGAVGAKYREYVQGTVVPIGSLKNNFVPVRPQVVRGTLLFLSQYKRPPKDLRTPFFTEGDGTSVGWEQFFTAERVVLPHLKRYCQANGILLQVCGRTAAANGFEHVYFQSVLGDTGWQFIPRTGDFGSYEAIDRAELVAFVDSTLGYESLARGKRTAAFCVRGESLRSPATLFGWPANLPERGPFWTDRSEESEFTRVLDYLRKVDEAEWQSTRQRYLRDVIEFDPGNSRLIGLLRQLGVSLDQKRYGDVH
jgi:surface carbohydrate biosynthesis protein